MRRFVLDFKAARKLVLAVALAALVGNLLTSAALAAAPAAPVFSSPPAQGSLPCAASASEAAQCGAAPVSDMAQLNLPGGSGQCPGSGPSAACSATASPATETPGVSSVPDGQSACPAVSASTVPTTPAACTNVVLSPGSVASGSGRTGSAGSAVAVLPSVPVASLQPVASVQRIALASDFTTVAAGHNAVLTATATNAVTGNSAIEIFDRTSGTLAGACTNASQCLVAYSARGMHTFAAYITAPTSTLPTQAGVVGSNRIEVGWLDSTITANNSVVGPGHAVTFTATSTVDVAKTGRHLVIYDLTSKTALTYCSRGTTCTTSVTQSTGGVHKVVGWVTGKPEAVSTPIYVTWLTISLAASTTSPVGGGTVYLRASTNTDLTTTPWVIGIYDQRGRLVDHACKTGRSCSVQAWVTGPTPSYTAVIGAMPQAASPPTPITKLLSNLAPIGLADVQARTAVVKPTRLLWGVDSCKSFTQDTAATTGLWPQVYAGYGTPDFWGRYLTNTVCPGISSIEIAAAAYRHMGILPIYNDYDCSAVSSYATGHAYATAAVAAAAGLGIPSGRVIAIDIEPPGAACPGAANVDSGFIEGWYDGVYGAGYTPAYYGNGTNGSEFATAWCSVVSALPNIARDSYLWSFEPSLQGSYARANAPNYSPYNPGCAGLSAVWQYQLSAGSDPDVDTDLAMSQLPLWYPQLAK